MERRIRADKRTHEALEAAGDTEGAKAVKKRIAVENKALHAYCDKEGLAYRQDRTQIYGYTDPKRKKKAVDFVETVDFSSSSGIIKTNKGNFEMPNYDVEITDKSIENIPLISVEGFSEKNNTQFLQAQKKILAEAQKHSAGTEARAQFGRIMYSNNPDVLKMFENLFTSFNESAIIALKDVI